MVRDAEPEVGRIVDGKYRLTRLIGRGGMGSVWEGIHTTLGTRFALKYIDVAFAGRKDVQARFANEALAAARLKSKHIVEVYDHGIDEHGCPYIVMEFLSGEPLDARLARDGVMTLTEAAEVVVQVSKALSRAHAASIVHRDLKPENLFLVWDDEDQKTVVKVVDFGIAKFSDGTGLDSATRTGAVLGTPHFMSPEQARGLKSVDHAADIWSLAVITYRAVTGRAPFDGEAVGDLLVKICTVEPVPPSEFVEVPAGFDVWIARSLAKEPKDRFPSVAAQAEALVALVDGVELGLSMVGGVESHVAGSTRHRTPVGKLGPPKSRGAAPALTSASTDGSIADTEAGLERPRTGRAPATRRLWWALPPLVALGALGVWMAQAPDEPTEALSSPEATSTTPAATAALSALAAIVPPAASPAGGNAPDAGPNRPAVELGRPADSAAIEPVGTAQKPPTRRKDPRPGPARPPSKPPTDELGY